MRSPPTSHTTCRPTSQAALSSARATPDRSAALRRSALRRVAKSSRLDRRWKARRNEVHGACDEAATSSARRSPSRSLGAQCIVCAINYNTAHPYRMKYGPKSRPGLISRYAWVARITTMPGCARLKQVEDECADWLFASGERASPPAAICWTGETPVLHHWHQALDTATCTPFLRRHPAPLIERVTRNTGHRMDRQNTCIINQQLDRAVSGRNPYSLDFTKTISHKTISRTMSSPHLPAPDRCGTCTRCITAVQPRRLLPGELDARLCISYLTIEKRARFRTSCARHGTARLRMRHLRTFAPGTQAPVTSARSSRRGRDWSIQRSSGGGNAPEEFRVGFRGIPYGAQSFPAAGGCQ